MRILLKGYYGFGNLGDDILLIVSFSLLRQKYPDSEIFVFSNFNENLAGFNQKTDYNRYIMKLLGEELKLIDWTYSGDFELLFNGGGGIYFDIAKGGWIYKILNISLEKLIGASGASKFDLILRLLTRKPHHLCFKKRIGVGIGIGEFASGSTTFFRKFSELGTYNFLWVRDEFSLKKLRKYQFKGRLAKFTDLAFLSHFWKPSKHLQIKSQPNFIGIVLMDLQSGNGELFQRLKEFAIIAQKSGYKISYFSFDENHDHQYIEAFTKEKIVVWRPNDISLENFIHQFELCDVVVSARAHGAILGACLGMIPICLASSKKLQEVALMFPESGVLFPIDVSSKRLMSEVTEISNNWKNKINALSRDLNVNKELAEQGNVILNKFL